MLNLIRSVVSVLVLILSGAVDPVPVPDTPDNPVPAVPVPVVISAEII